MRFPLPRKSGEAMLIEGPERLVLQVKKIDRGTYFAKIMGTHEHARWGNASQIREDISHFLDTGALPRSKMGRW